MDNDAPRPPDEDLRRLAISARQAQVLAIVKANYGGVLDGPLEPKLCAIAAIIGWKNTTGVRDCLRALRAKGAVRSHGSNTNPSKWEITP